MSDHTTIIRTDPPPTERTVQLRIMAEIRSVVVIAAPNYTPAGWWECDLWAVTKAGYAVEYEIKLSVADFKNDATKSVREHRYISLGKWEWEEVKKYDRLAASDPKGPTRFYYVVPEELRAAIEPRLPEWAGLGIFKGRRVLFVREARRLHNTKVGIREIRLAQRRMCFRYWDAIGDLDRLRLRGVS